MRWLLNEFINNRRITIGKSKYYRRMRMYWVLDCRMSEYVSDIMHIDEVKPGHQYSLFE